MKVAFIDPANNSTFYNYSLFSALEANGYEVSFFTSRTLLHEELKIDKLKSVRYFFLRMSAKIALKYPNVKQYRAFRFFRGGEFLIDLLRLYTYLKYNRYEVVHIHWTLVPYFTSLLVKILVEHGIKVVYTVNNMYGKGDNSCENAENKWVRQMLKYSDRIIVFTEKTKSDLLNFVDVKAEKVCVVRHGNYDIFKISRGLSKDTARKILGISNEKKVILFFGQVEYYKGIGYLIKALNIVKEKEQKIYLVIAGNVSDLLGLEKQIRRYALEPFVMIVPTIIPYKEVENYFVCSDIVAMPHIISTHSGIHHMAYSFGKPVIATTCGELSQTVEDGKSGFLVPSKNERALGDAILAYFSLDEKGRSEMSRYCLKIAKEKYSWSKSAHELMEVYSNCLALSERNTF